MESFVPDKNKSFEEKIYNWVHNAKEKINKYILEYEDYFERNSKFSKEAKTQLDPLPRLILIPGIGLIGIGINKKSSKVAADIGQAWIETVLSATSIGILIS